VSDWLDAPRFGADPPSAAPVARPSAYALIVNAQGRLAVVCTDRGYFLPGGGLETGEGAAEAIVREVLEECGFVVRAGEWMVRAVDIVYSPHEDTHFEKQSVFLEAHPERDAMDTSTGSGWGWLDVRDAAQHLLQPSHRWAVEQWRERSHH
jgi:8-oxo-dGTP diphosphatase